MLATGAHSGEGEVVGIADSGLDVHSCFFFDKKEDIPFDTFSSTHRKVVSYHTTVDNADAEGHGTLVSGSAAGSCVSQKHRSLAVHHGLAKDAKIAFMDIGQGSGDTGSPVVIRPPGDLDINLFSVLYDDVSDFLVMVVLSDKIV